MSKKKTKHAPKGDVSKLITAMHSQTLTDVRAGKKKKKKANADVVQPVAALHSRTVSAATLFAAPVCHNFAPGDVVRVRGGGTEIVTEALLRAGGYVDYATTGGAWYKADDFELLSVADADSRRRAAQAVEDEEEADWEEV